MKQVEEKKDKEAKAMEQKPIDGNEDERMELNPQPIGTKEEERTE